MKVITSIGSLAAPIFSYWRDAATGAGWIIGAKAVKFADGGTAVHMHWSFETEKEAMAEFSELRRKTA